MTYQRHQSEDTTLKPVSGDKPRCDGTWLFLYHIYIGRAYQGCMEALNPVQAVSEWAKRHRLSQINLHAVLSPNVLPKKVHGKTKKSKQKEIK